MKVGRPVPRQRRWSTTDGRPEREKKSRVHLARRFRNRKKASWFLLTRPISPRSPIQFFPDNTETFPGGVHSALSHQFAPTSTSRRKRRHRFACASLIFQDVAHPKEKCGAWQPEKGQRRQTPWSARLVSDGTGALPIHESLLASTFLALSSPTRPTGAIA